MPSDRVDQIFYGAMDLPPDEQSAYLEKACADDPRLRREVESLLAFESGADARIHSAIAHVSDALPTTAPARLGPYRVLHEIGRGGMGTVYLAVREGDSTNEHVAVKLVNPGAATVSVLARVRQEREILARLLHPNIARLLDGGVTSDGLPFLVMEYVEGQAITTWCRQHELSRGAILQLFLKVCDAVAHAHRNLIVHRDLKPANIFVTAEGDVKLLDFGIARLMGPAGSTLTLSETGALGPMTPEYASPEQVRGEPVTTATDVYSLGAVLYELLTGKRPHQIETYSLAEIERVICQTDPLPPSSVTSEPLPADLDSIVLMALRKEPDRRYQSVEALAADLINHLEYRPIRARPDTIRYRAGKFVRRNRASVLAATLALLTSVGGLTATLWQARRAAQEAERANRRFQQVRKLANVVVFDLHDRIRKLPNSAEAREVLIRTSLEYLDSLAAEAPDDTKLLLELAAAYERIGEVQDGRDQPSLNRTGDALSSVNKAIELAARANVRDEPSALLLRARATSHAGRLTMLTSGGLARARQLLQESYTLAQQYQAMPGHDPQQARLILIRIHQLSGDGRMRTSDVKGALAHYEQAVPLIKQAIEEQPVVSVRRLFGAVHTRIGRAQAAGGNIEASAEAYRIALESHERLLKAYPDDLLTKRELLATNVSITTAFRNAAGDRKIKVPEHAHYALRALTLAKELVAAEPTNLLAKHDLSACLESYANTLTTKDPQQALKYYYQALKIIDELSAQNPVNVTLKVQRAESQRNVDRILGRHVPPTVH